MPLQQECQYLQIVTSGIGPLFALLKESVIEYSPPPLVEGPKEEVNDALHKITNWVVKRAGIGIPDPTQTIFANFDVSA